MWARYGFAVAVAIAAGAGACSAIVPGGAIGAYELRLDLRADGSVAVEERGTFDLADVPAGRIVFPVPDERVDRVQAMEAEIDGVAARASDVELRAVPGGGLVWSRPSDDPPREIRLSYEAIGTLEVHGARGVFTWPAVPPGHGTIDTAQVTIVWPEGSVPMEGPTGGPGWDVALGERSAVLTAKGVDRSSAAPIYLDLALADTSFAEPDWQLAWQRAEQLAPAFISAGLFVIVVAMGVLLMLRIRHATVAAVVSEPRDGAAVPRELADELTRLPRWRSSGEAVDRLVEAGLIDRERLAVGRGLMVSGLAIVVVGIACAALAQMTMRSLGPALLALPAGLVAAGLILFVRGASFPARTRLGLEVGMLHSRRLRSSREP